jgi:hypothetical protein
MNEQTTISTWAKQLHTVFGAASMLAIPFALATPYASYIRKRMGGFPLLYLHGDPASGKTALTKALDFHQDQPALYLCSNGAGLYQMMNDKFEQEGRLVIGEEYQNEMDWLDERLKMAWDGMGYEFAYPDGLVTKHSGLQGSLVITGNQYPNDPALLSRMLVLEMKAGSYDAVQIEQFNSMQNMLRDGLDDILLNTIQWKAKFQADWDEVRKLAQIAVDPIMDEEQMPYRMKENATILFAVHLFFSAWTQLPYESSEVLEYLRKCLVAQHNNMQYASKVAKGIKHAE